GVSHARALAAAPALFGPTLPDRCPGATDQPWLERWPRPPVDAVPSWLRSPPLPAGRRGVFGAARPGGAGRHAVVRLAVLVADRRAHVERVRADRRGYARAAGRRRAVARQPPVSEHLDAGCLPGGEDGRRPGPARVLALPRRARVRGSRRHDDRALH